MKNLPMISEVRKLAKQFGTPMKRADFTGNGIRFVYAVGKTEYTKTYPDADSGIELEVDRLKRFLSVEC